ncbi:hypothetical protein ABPG74_022475 [Tetrahymena malaccensis]
MSKLGSLILIALLFTSVYCACDYTISQGNYSGGCSQNCKDFDTIEHAKAACDADSTCQGITFSQKGSGGSASTGASGNGWGYQLRASQSTSHSPSGETSWIKGQCQPAFVCDFQPYPGQYLGGCFNDCQDFSSLDAAIQACRQQTGCGGVTFSKRSVGGSKATNAFDGAWGYQLRSSTSPSGSPNGEDSWGKINCTSYQQGDCYVIHPGDYSGGCAQNCKDFSTLSQAKDACNKDSSCQGVTFSQPNGGGSQSSGASGNGWGYQLRASSSTNHSPSGENTWIKTDCSNLFPCDFLPSQGYYIGGCFNNCQDYKTLAEAQAACRSQSGCGGVTFSKKSVGGSSANNAFDGAWGYQLRSGKNLVLSPNGEDSWLKQSCGQYAQIPSQCTYSYNPGDYSGGCSQNCKDFSNIEDAKNACNADPTCNAVTFSQRTSGGGASTGASGNGWGYQLRATKGSTHSPSGETTWVKQSCQPATTFPCFFQQASQGYYLGGCYNNCKDYASLQDAQNNCLNKQGCGGVTFSKKNIGGSNASNAYDGAWGYQLRSSTTPSLSPNGEDSWVQVCLNYPALFTGCNFTGQMVAFPPGVNVPSLNLSQYHSLYVPNNQYLNLFTSSSGKPTTYSSSVSCLPQGFVQFVQLPHSITTHKSVEHKLKKNRQ